MRQRKTLTVAGILLLGILSHGYAADRIDTEGDPLTVDQKRTLFASRDQAFQALNERIRDPFVHLGPDGYYYVTGTTAGSHWGETVGIRIWRSRDLAAWEDLGFVWDLLPQRDMVGAPLPERGRARPPQEHDRQAGGTLRADA